MKYSDGWHKICGFTCYVENGMVIRTANGSLYKWLKKENCRTNMLPCKPSVIRAIYYNENSGGIIEK